MCLDRTAWCPGGERLGEGRSDERWGVGCVSSVRVAIECASCVAAYLCTDRLQSGLALSNFFNSVSFFAELPGLKRALLSPPVAEEERRSNAGGAHSLLDCDLPTSMSGAGADLDADGLALAATLVAAIHAATDGDACVAALQALTAAVEERRVAMTKKDAIAACKAKRQADPGSWNQGTASALGRLIKAFRGGDAVAVEPPAPAGPPSFDGVEEATEWFKAKSAEFELEYTIDLFDEISEVRVCVLYPAT